MKHASLAVVVVLFLLPGPSPSAQSAIPTSPEEESPPAPPQRASPIVEEGDIAAAPTNASSICEMVKSAAAANGLPLEFFARVIWQESRFRSNALGPVTRSGQQAQGIAQFMPMTAEERLLRDPFDPIQALPKSAEFLRDLRIQFGNLGLAAAAYNAGPQRIRNWLAGKASLPSETQSYVRIVTGRSAQEWVHLDQSALSVTIPKEMSCTESVTPVVKPQPSLNAVQPKPTAWVVQLIGDSSESRALTMYRHLQKKHQALLGSYPPVLVRTTLRAGVAPIWSRVRVDADDRRSAEMLCSSLRVAGERCLVQRN